jgi:hypothetical protein
MQDVARSDLKAKRHHYLIVGGGIAFGFLLGIIAGQAHVDWPAWTQAVGSVGAIIAAIWLAGASQREQRLQTFRRERAYLERSKIVLNWMILDGRDWAAATFAGADALRVRLASYDPGTIMMGGMARIAAEAGRDCPDPQLSGSFALLPKWHEELLARAAGVVDGTISLDNKPASPNSPITLGARELADVYVVTLAEVLKRTEMVIESIR